MLPQRDQAHPGQRGQPPVPQLLGSQQKSTDVASQRNMPPADTSECRKVAIAGRSGREKRLFPDTSRGQQQVILLTRRGQQDAETDGAGRVL